VGVEYERDKRFAGEPKYTLRSLLRLAYDGIFAFSSVPVKLMQLVGFVAASGAALVGLVYLVISLVVATPPGFPTIMLSIWLLGGVQLFAFGLLGEYVFRTYEEARHRPNAMVREVVSFDE
jgi:dolichol-phosphate mannosyltransferase